MGSLKRAQGIDLCWSSSVTLLQGVFFYLFPVISLLYFQIFMPPSQVE